MDTDTNRTVIPFPGAPAAPADPGVRPLAAVIRQLRLLVDVSTAALEELRVTLDLTQRSLAAIESSDLAQMRELRGLLQARLDSRRCRVQSLIALQQP